jgi:hypothetical protein
MAGFARHTPEAVRQLIDQYRTASQFGPQLLAAIERLAANAEMEYLWNTQVPPRLRGRESEIIAQAIIAYCRAISLQPPLKNWMRDYTEFRQNHPDPITDLADLAACKERFVAPLTYAMLAGRARMLLEGMNEIPSLTRAGWGEVWQGDPAMTFDGLISTVEAIAVSCDRLDKEAGDMLVALQLPKQPRKRGGKTAPRVYFDRIMKGYFRRECGKPIAEVVALLEQVLFDLPDAVDESTVLKR